MKWHTTTDDSGEGDDTVTKSECACDPNPGTTEGAVAWCDVHGQPSVAYAAGYDAALRDMQDQLRLMAAPPMTTVEWMNHVRMPTGEDFTETYYDPKLIGRGLG